MNTQFHIDQVINKTRSDESIINQRQFVDRFFENWVGEFLHPYGDDLLEHRQLNNSLFYCYLSAQSTNFDWYSHTLYSGAYTVVFRELRCILEGLFIVFKIEADNLKKTLDEKMGILSTAENKYFGKKVFETSGFPQWSIYYEVYQDLSSYIHFSYSRVAAVIRKVSDGGFPETVEYVYDRSRFLDAVRVWRKMSDLAVEMAQELASRNGFSITATKEIFDL